MSDYWWEQRYDDAMFAEHEKGHPNSESKNCPHCQPIEKPYEETLDEAERTGN